MIEKIIIGIVIGFIGSAFLLNTDDENDSLQTILGIFVIVALIFIGSSFAYGFIYGLMAFGEIILGFAIASFIFSRKEDKKTIHEPIIEKEVTKKDLNIQLLEKALEKSKASKSVNESEPIDLKVRMALELIERDKTRIPEGKSIFSIIVAGVLDEWLAFNKLLDEGSLTKDEFIIKVDELIENGAS